MPRRLTARFRPAVACLALAAALAAGSPARAEDMRAEDARRLARFEASFGAALIEALQSGTPDDIDALEAALRGPPVPVDLAAIEGVWTCRMMKLGRLLPLVVYDSFRCRFSVEDGGLVFEKLTGSQLTRGRIESLDGRLVYLGTTFLRGETPTPYADLPEVTDPAAMPQHFPDVGLLEVAGPDRARILFPGPVLESLANVLELRR